MSAEQRIPIQAFARQLRHRSTDAEKRLWRALRHRRLRGFKFRRQHPVSPYILDFYCAELKLAVELDGGGHLNPEQQAHDQRRTQFLNTQNIRVLRLKNFDVLVETEALVDHLWVIVTQMSGFPGAEGIGPE